MRRMSKVLSLIFAVSMTAGCVGHSARPVGTPVLGLAEGVTWHYQHVHEDEDDHAEEPANGHEHEHDHDEGHSDHKGTDVKEHYDVVVGAPIEDRGSTWYPVTKFPGILRFTDCEISEDEGRVRLRNIGSAWQGPKEFDLLRLPLAEGLEWRFPLAARQDVNVVMTAEGLEQIELNDGTVQAWKIALRVKEWDDAIDYFWIAPGRGIVQIGDGVGDGSGTRVFRLTSEHQQD